MSIDIAHLRELHANWSNDSVGIGPVSVRQVMTALPELLDEVERLRALEAEFEQRLMQHMRLADERIAQLKAALREIEPAALYHPQQVWPDELKAIIKRLVGIARAALANKDQGK